MDGFGHPLRFEALGGEDTETGGRVLKVARRVDADRMIVAYGDSLSDIDLGALVAFHEAHGKPATVTAVEAPRRWGTLDLAYHHTGYWAPMDTPAEQDELDRLWATGAAPWAARPAPSEGR